MKLGYHWDTWGLPFLVAWLPDGTHNVLLLGFLCFGVEFRFKRKEPKR